jgi:hypothetical protein
MTEQPDLWGVLRRLWPNLLPEKRAQIVELARMLSLSPSTRRLLHELADLEAAEGREGVVRRRSRRWRGWALDELGGFPLSTPWVRSGYTATTGAPSIALSEMAAATVVRAFGSVSPPLHEDGLVPDLAHAVDFLLMVYVDTLAAPASDLVVHRCGGAAVEAVLRTWDPLGARGGWPPPPREEGLRLSLVGGLPEVELAALTGLSRRLWREVDCTPEPAAAALARLSEELVHLARGFGEVGDDEMALAIGPAAGALWGQVSTAGELSSVWRRVCEAVPELVEEAGPDEP